METQALEKMARAADQAGWRRRADLIRDVLAARKWCPKWDKQEVKRPTPPRKRRNKRPLVCLNTHVVLRGKLKGRHLRALTAPQLSGLNGAVAKKAKSERALIMSYHDQARSKNRDRVDRASANATRWYAEAKASSRDPRDVLL